MLLDQEQKKKFDATRLANGYMTVDQVLDLSATNTILDPFSLLIAQGAKIGSNNTFMSNVVLKCSEEGVLRIGNGNTFHANTSFEASAGPISVGDENTFGEGAVIVKANVPGSAIEIGSNGRYVGQINVFGSSILGDGSQVLGNITIYSCNLEGGESHNHPDPDKRAAVLKGSGTAKTVNLTVGKVMKGQGNFDVPIESQSAYHPKKGG